MLYSKTLRVRDDFAMRIVTSYRSQKRNNQCSSANGDSTKSTEQIQQTIVLYQSHDRQPEKIYRCVGKHTKDIHTSGFIDLAQQRKFG